MAAPAYTTARPEQNLPSMKDAVNRIQDFELIHAQRVRIAKGATTGAWELTLRVPSGLQFSPEALKGGRIGAGMQIAILPMNDDATVARALQGLRDVPKGPVAATLPKRDGVAAPDSKLSAAQVLAHTVDLTRPTKELKACAGITSESHEFDYIPVEEFLQMPGIKGRISFQQLVACQPALANRKYTPSEVDVQAGTLKIIVSEVHRPTAVYNRDDATGDAPLAFAGRGTSSGYLADLALQAGRGKPPVVQGFLDVRKHKLPYDYAKPMILLSTGVGVAPHVAMLREAKQLGLKPDVRLMLNGTRYEFDDILKVECLDMLDAVCEKGHALPGRNGNRSLLEIGSDVLLGGLTRRPRNRYESVHSQHLHPQESSKTARVPELLAGKYSELIWRCMQSGREDVIYICGLEGLREGTVAALEKIGNDHGVDGKAWAQAIVASGRIQHSVSEPDRFYTKWDKARAERAEKEPELAR